MELQSSNDRKHLEAQFHDQRERERRDMSPEEWEHKYSNKKWYAVTRQHRRYMSSILAASAPGSTALDYCCGVGETALTLAEAGAANVYGIDISAESVRAARERLKGAGFEGRAQLETMDAERLAFPDNMFDLIVCAGVLHHLDVGNAFRELARVLKPSGQVVCVEALGYNPLIRLYRKRTPHLRTEWEAQHILTLRELAVAHEHFQAVHVRFFYLFAILAVPFRRWKRLFSPLLSALEILDRAALRIPGVRRLAWQMVFTLGEPT